MFFNDDYSPFLLELSENELPAMRLLKAYQKLHLYIPSDLEYILACKLMAARPEKDLADIEALCRTLGIQNLAQAQQVVNQYFPSFSRVGFFMGPLLERVHEPPCGEFPCA